MKIDVVVVDGYDDANAFGMFQCISWQTDFMNFAWLARAMSSHSRDAWHRVQPVDKSKSFFICANPWSRNRNRLTFAQRPFTRKKTKPNGFALPKSKANSAFLKLAKQNKKAEGKNVERNATNNSTKPIFRMSRIWKIKIAQMAQTTKTTESTEEFQYNTST